MTFNFASPATGSPALNLAHHLQQGVDLLRLRQVGTGKTYYFDDVTFVTGTGTNTAGGDVRREELQQHAVAAVDPDRLRRRRELHVGRPLRRPAGRRGTGKAARVVKNAGEVWAGTSMQRKPNDAVPTIPFATGATKMSVRVYSAYAGVRVHLKVEQSGRPDFNSEVGACTTLVNAWETLTFDFGPAGLHFVPTGPCPGGYQTDPTALPADCATRREQDLQQGEHLLRLWPGRRRLRCHAGYRTYYFDDVKFIGN